MAEEDARLELLKTELNSVDNSIRSLDAIVFQIKGWCVTATLAIGGFAVSTHTPALTLVGLVAVIGFYFLNCQFKVIQRAFINRNQALDRELKSVGVMQVLRGEGTLKIVGTAMPEFSPPGTSYSASVRLVISGIQREARMTNTFTLYLFLLICLTVEAIFVFV